MYSKGVECPYKEDCPLNVGHSDCTPHMLPRAYFITTADIDQIIILTSKNIALLNGVDPLSIEEVEVFKSRSRKEKIVPFASEWP